MSLPATKAQLALAKIKVYLVAISDVEGELDTVNKPAKRRTLCDLIKDEVHVLERNISELERNQIKKIPKVFGSPKKATKETKE